jgi:HD-GYP domain-containing protein (c-di-GMP phosphodiesterase class II)
VKAPLTQTNVRLAEVVAALSLATDLATGQPLEHGLRRALLAVWLGEALGLSEAELRDAYYGALLGGVGCTIEDAALSGFFKDEIAFAEQVVLVDPTHPLEMAAFFLGKVGEGDPPLRRAGKLLSFARLGPREHAIICRDVALQAGELLDLDPPIREIIGQIHEQWGGDGGPRRLKREEISLGTRILHIAHDAEVFHRVKGVEAALALVRARAGKVYDPRIAARFCDVGGQFLARLPSETPWDAVLAAEPAPARSLSPRALDEMVHTLAHFVDLRLAYTLGHSPRVAALAEAAGRGFGLSAAEAAALRWAGLLHDLGRASVPVTLWIKAEPLAAPEWEWMKRHPALTELVLARSGALGHLGKLAGLHHERLDGTGYRGVPASFLPVAARVLAAADAYQSKLEPRP